MRISFKKVFVPIISIAVILSGLFLYNSTNKELNVAEELEEFRGLNSELPEIIDDLLNALNTAKNDPGDQRIYFDIGLGWKSVADRMINVELKEKYYKKSLDAYKQGILLTDNRDTIYIVNAGNICVLLNDYEQAERYYKQAIEVTPGDVGIYMRLADLYLYQMKKEPQFIIEFLESSKEVVFDLARINKYIEQLKEE